MNIHFVCRGNAFRSRLAEGYLGKNDPSISVSSSGIEASKNLNGSICWYAQCIADNNAFVQYLSSSWQQTSQELLTAADIIVALDHSIAETLATQFSLPGERILVWDIPDVLTEQHVYEKSTDLLREAVRCWDVLRQSIDMKWQTSNAL